jgi:uncharacterized membrane protein (DUF485 family)
MILLLALTSAIIGILYSIKAKKIFDKGLSESDSYRMVMGFNKSKRMRKHSTIFLIVSMITFIIYFIQILITYGNSKH